MLAALAYSGSFLLLAIPNATLSILIVFFAGWYLRLVAGVLVGAIAALLITIFNPYGLAPLPIVFSQVFGYVLIGATGAMSSRLGRENVTAATRTVLALLAIITALEFQIPVSLVDAWLYQPFWERLALSVPFALVTIGANVLFFVILFPVLANVQKIAMFRVD